MNQNKHIPVLLQEAVTGLLIQDGGTYIDGTLGGAGHFELIRQNINTGYLIGCDIDPEAIMQYKENSGFRWESTDDLLQTKTEGGLQICLVQKSFDEIIDILQSLKLPSANGILLDLGWSTNQLEGIKGLSFANEQDDLDMRMNTRLAVTAADLVNGLGKQELKKLFLYADIYGKHANTLTELIAKTRSQRQISTVGDLNAVITDFIEQSRIKENRQSLLARVFLALRIAVNDEYGNLKRFLEIAATVLVKKGRLCIITFHSGEENIVQTYLDQSKKHFKLIMNKTKPYLQPSVQELRANLSARSAKLWILERT